MNHQLLGGRAADLLGRRRAFMAGLAFGLSNTAFQIGAAIVSTVVVSWADGDSLLALTEGFQASLVACAVLAGVGPIVSLLLLGPPRQRCPAPVTEEA
jgi:MFS family permease